MSLLTIDDQELKNRGFTSSGSQHFKETVEAYADQLSESSISNGNMDKAPNMQLEVTYQHVRQSAHYLANRFGKPKRPWWVVPAQAVEYLLTALAGYGVNLMTQSDVNIKNQGIRWFIISAGIAIVLIVVRLIKNKSE